MSVNIDKKLTGRWVTDPLGHWPGVTTAQIIESMGYIPLFIPDLGSSAAAQINENYAKYGGWSPMSGWHMADDGVITYSLGGDHDEPRWPAARLDKTDGEIVRFYPNAWVSITQSNGDYEVAKID